MMYAFVWIVLWLNTGNPQLTPEAHTVMALNAMCDDPDLKAAAYHDAVAQSAHQDQIIGADMWCDELMAREAPPKQPAGST